MIIEVDKLNPVDLCLKIVETPGIEPGSGQALLQTSTSIVVN